MSKTHFITKLVEAHRGAQDDADKHSLPQTVFYHPDHGYDNCATHGLFLQRLEMKSAQQFVTWLPSNWFN